MFEIFFLLITTRGKMITMRTPVNILENVCRQNIPR